jgi:hypothetical protein
MTKDNVYNLFSLDSETSEKKQEFIIQPQFKIDQFIDINWPLL